MEPGEGIFFNNCTMLHTRTAFEDHPDPARKRHLLRLWLMLDGRRPLVPAVHAYKGTTGIAGQSHRSTYYTGAAMPSAIDRPPAGGSPRRRVHRRARADGDRGVRRARRGAGIRQRLGRRGPRRRPVRDPRGVRDGHVTNPSRHEHLEHLRAHRAHDRDGGGDRGPPLGRPLPARAGLEPSRAGRGRAWPSLRPADRSAARDGRRDPRPAARRGGLAPRPAADHRALRPLVPPRRPAIPIYLAGVFRPMLEICGEIADGAILTWSTLEWARRRRRARRRGRAPRRPRPVGDRCRRRCSDARSATTRGGAPRLQPGVALYAGFFPRYNRLLAESGFAGRGVGDPRRVGSAAIVPARSRCVPDALVDAVALVGTAERCRERIAELPRRGHHAADRHAARPRRGRRRGGEGRDPRLRARSLIRSI